MAHNLPKTKFNWISGHGQNSRLAPLTFLILVVVLNLELSAQTRRDPIRLTHGPMLGMSTSKPIRVWGRTSEAGPFYVRYGTSAANLDQQSPPTLTTVGHDNTGTVYHYQLYVNDLPHGLPGNFGPCPAARNPKTKITTPKAFLTFVSRSAPVQTRIPCMVVAIELQPTNT